MRAALAVLLAAVVLAAKDPPPVRPQPVDTYAAKEAHDGVTIAAEPYDLGSKTKPVFGKCDPLAAPTNVMPVYLVISNGTKDVLRLEKWTVEFITADRQRAEPIPAGVVGRMISGGKVKGTLDPPRMPFPRPKGCDTSAADLLVAREFLLKMVPPGDTVGGFLFFHTAGRKLPDVLRGAKLYLNGMKWGSSGKELFYFEINFDDYLKSK